MSLHSALLSFLGLSRQLKRYAIIHPSKAYNSSFLSLSTTAQPSRDAPPSCRCREMSLVSPSLPVGAALRYRYTYPSSSHSRSREDSALILLIIVIVFTSSAMVSLAKEVAHSCRRCWLSLIYACRLAEINESASTARARTYKSLASTWGEFEAFGFGEGGQGQGSGDADAEGACEVEGGGEYSL